VLEIERRVLGPEHPDTLASMGKLVVTYANWSWALSTAADVAERDPIKAVKLAQLAIELHPHFAKIWNNLGVAQYRAGNWQAAVETLEKADSMLPAGDREHRMFLAMAHWQLGDKDKAHARYAQGAAWIALHGKGSEAQGRFRAEAEQLLEITAEDRQRLVEAYLTRQVADQPDVAQVWIDRARWHQQQGAHEQAISDFTEAIRLDLENAGLYRTRAEAYLALDRYDEALADWNRLAELSPDDAVAALIRAQLLLAAGRTDEYRAACLEMLERFEDSADPWQVYHAARACTLAPDGTGDPERIVEMATEVVSHFPDLPWVIYTLGLAHLRAGQLAEATQRLQESVNAAPDWPPGHFLTSFGLALVHHQRGETQQVREWYAKGVGSMKEPRPSAAQDWLECQLLRREVEQLLANPDKNQQDEESTETPRSTPALLTPN
jgi:tetratricopeptide (TPR) repeat protein